MFSSPLHELRILNIAKKRCLPVFYGASYLLLCRLIPFHTAYIFYINVRVCIPLSGIYHSGQSRQL